MADPKKHKSRGTNDDFQIILIILEELPGLKRRVIEKLRPVAEDPQERNRRERA